MYTTQHTARWAPSFSHISFIIWLREFMWNKCVSCEGRISDASVKLILYTVRCEHPTLGSYLLNCFFFVLLNAWFIRRHIHALIFEQSLKRWTEIRHSFEQNKVFSCVAFVSMLHLNNGLSHSSNESEEVRLKPKHGRSYASIASGSSLYQRSGKKMTWNDFLFAELQVRKSKQLNRETQDGYF